MLTGWAFSALWLFGSGPGLREVPSFTPGGWMNILILGVFGSGLAYIAWYDALKAMPAGQLGAFIYVEPLVTMVLATFLLGEAVTLVSLLGGAATIAGVYLVNR